MAFRNFITGLIVRDVIPSVLCPHKLHNIALKLLILNTLERVALAPCTRLAKQSKHRLLSGTIYFPKLCLAFAMQIPALHNSLSSLITPGGAYLGSDDPPSYKDILLDELQMLLSDFRKDVLAMKRLQTEDTEAMVDLDRAMSKAQESLLVLRPKLQEIQLEFMQENHTLTVSAEIVRLQISRMSSLYKEYYSALKEYLSAQIICRDKCMERMKKRFLDSDISIKDEDREIVLTEDSLLQDIFDQMALEQTEEGRQAIAGLEAEHMKILKLHNSIQELDCLIEEIARRIDSCRPREIRLAMPVAQSPDVGLVTHFPEPAPFRVTPENFPPSNREINETKLCGIIGIVVIVNLIGIWIFYC